MRAVTITHPGGPEVLAITEVPTPTATGSQVLIEVAAAGLNRADLLQRMGHYPPPPGFPADIPGMEFAGTVAAVGPNVTRWQPGDRVFGLIGGAAQAEFLVTEESLLAAVPDGMDLVTAAAVPEVFITAFDALQQGGLRPDSTVVIHAVGSGVGTAALQLARAAGATVYGTARTATKLEQARQYGLAGGFLTSPDAPPWNTAVRNATGDRGVDLVLDFIGGPQLAANLDVLALRGCLVVIGTMGGAQAELNLGLLMRKRASIVGTVLRSRSTAEKAALTAAFAAEVVPLLSAGTITPIIDQVFPLADVAAAHRTMEANTNFGKLVLQMR